MELESNPLLERSAFRRVFSALIVIALVLACMVGVTWFIRAFDFAPTNTIPRLPSPTAAPPAPSTEADPPSAPTQTLPAFARVRTHKDSSYAGFWVTRLIRRRDEPAFQ